VNFLALRKPRSDMVLVAAAGPSINILLAILAALLFHFVSYLSRCEWKQRGCWPQDRVSHQANDGGQRPYPTYASRTVFLGLKGALDC
jgi:hypothetical protein